MKESKINLLPQNEFEKTTMGRVLRWTLSSFRIIVIITEMIVMAAFLSRFWFDARNSDLNEILGQKQATIEGFKETEKEFRLVQQRLEILSKISEQIPLSSYLKTTTSFLPPDVSLTSVSLSDDSFIVIGSSGSERGIAQFITNLESKYKEVTLSNIDTSTKNESFLVFTLNIKK